jgi:hypothetical protein
MVFYLNAATVVKLNQTLAPEERKYDLNSSQGHAGSLLHSHASDTQGEDYAKTNQDVVTVRFLSLNPVEEFLYHRGVSDRRLIQRGGG